MAYKRRRKNKSGFSSYCKAALSRVKRASKSSSRAKAAFSYQKCLSKKHGIKTGIKSKTLKKVKKKM
jgi:hypothetical protein